MHPLLKFAALALFVEAVTSDHQPQQALPGCKSTCGDIQIPYPFGIGNSTTQNHTPCYMNSKFILTCKNNSKLIRGTNIPVLDINPLGQMVFSFSVSYFCTNNSSKSTANSPFLRVPSLTISSTENKFITVGCDSYGYLNSNFKGATYSTGCLTRCYDYDPKMVIGNNTGKCTGLGCCQVDIPPLMRNITIQSSQFPDSTPSVKHYCSYSFIAKQGSYSFSVDDLNNLPKKRFPMVVNWAVSSESCQIAQTKANYACKENSECVDNDLDYDGYRCNCSKGFEGNPYLPGGCSDIDECATEYHGCKSKANCNNTFGNYTCFCPEGEIGDGTEGGGCQLEHNENANRIVLPTVLGAGAVFIVLFVMIIFYSINQKRKLTKLKEKFYKQNGGSILEQKLSQRQDSSSSQIAHIFKENELKKATNNFDESLIIGRGGFGTVFKGELEDKRIVAIKKSKTIDESQIEQFINEVDVVSQINHRNVVKLLGCCLETEVPLLVYEFVSNGTLSELIHKEIGKVNNVSWKTRLKIAAEVAGALSYLHSAASIPIIHRDVKCDNILLDGTNTAKVSDFGASRLVPLDQMEVATMVQGTIGYLDPEYMQTSQLTEKSDVYSFGVVLVELLTGEKPFSFGRAEDRRSLAMHFLSCLKKDNVFEVIQDGLLNEENEREIKEVAVLAAKCLRLRGEERPSMKEVAMELEGMQLIDKQSWIYEDVNIEESRYLLHESSSSLYELGDSSKQGDYGYDSLKDHVLIALDDGR
ncbi:putative wall-associated receptor kinase-like 16 [Vicia villosa]|uniref:putative wall-associated receptor kinase-like 16 n=1 Tax=Vicia villosa TaxID=3911 RepID=UPI00273CDF44|nr:putative wall-associated receptor kinase-like 16 [Vicia villosa]